MSETKIKLICENSNGSTFLVKERDKTYVKKVLKGATEEVFKKLEAEASALKNLDHPCIPQLVEVSSNGGLSITREYMLGKSLEELLREKKTFSQLEVVQFGLQVLDVLDYVHSKNIIHRDIKPGNIICNLEDSSIALVDFGLAKLGYFGGTSSSMNGGTYSYIAPEQYLGKALPATDIFALGSTMVEVLSGRTLEYYSAGESIFDGFDLSKLQVEPALKRVLERMTNVDSKARYKTAKEAYADLEKIINRDTSLALRSCGELAPTGAVKSADIAEKYQILFEASPEDNFYPTEKVKAVLEDFLKESGFELIDKEEYVIGYKYYFKIYGKDNRNGKLCLFFKQLNAPFYCFVTLKSKEWYNKFRKQFLKYVKETDINVGKYAQKYWESLELGTPEQKTELNNFNTKVEDRQGAVSILGTTAVICSLGLPLTLYMGIGIPLGLGGGAYFYLKKRKLLKQGPKLFSDEEVQQLLPYEGKILFGKEAIKAIYETCQ